MTKETATIMKDLMRAVVAEGTGGNAAVSGIEVSGKTGTADHKDDASEQDAPHSWFIGFAPYDNPTNCYSGNCRRRWSWWWK